jgi:hypothetical protein
MTEMTEEAHFQLHLASDAHDLWVKHMAACEDAEIDADYGVEVLATAAAMCAGFFAGTCAKDGVPDAELRAMVDDFELTLLKTLADVAPRAMSDETRRRMASLDRRVKRSRDLPTEPGGEA